LTGTSAADRRNPFPGLRPFGDDEEYLFFGRDAQVDNLLERLSRRRFVAVVGTSGSGKSSLVRAGLLPSLYGGFMVGAASHWLVAIMRPGSSPTANLAQALDKSGALGEPSEKPELRIGVARTALEDGSLGLVEIARHAGMTEDDNLLVVVDQFEELFRFHEDEPASSVSDEAAAFVKLLLAASAQRELPIYVVITMRSDFLGECARFRNLPETVNDGLFLVPRLTDDQLRLAIEGPLRVAGTEVAPTLVNRLLNDLGEDQDQDQLPVLQHALMRTYDIWREDHRPGEPVDQRHYDETGGLKEALSRHGEQIYWKSLPDDRSRSVAERLFKCLTDLGADNRGLRRPTRFGDVLAITGASRDELMTVIEAFRAPSCSFLTPRAGKPVDDDTFLDISHESLMRVWGRLQGWVEEEAQSAQTYRRIAEAASLYAQQKAALWRNEDLALAKKWRDETRPTPAWARRLIPVGRPRTDEPFEAAERFLDLSEEAQDAELEAQRRHERDRQRRRLDQLVTQRTRIAAFATAALALVAFALAALAWQERQGLQSALGRLQETSSELRVTQLGMQAAETARLNPGQRLQFQIYADPATLNPLIAHTNHIDQQLAHLAFEPFFDLDQRGRPVPELLSVIPTVANGGISADGRTIVYHLRRGLRWSDGAPLTSNDVLFTLRAILDPQNPVPSREGYELIDKAEGPDPYTVRFHLKRPWAPAVSTLFAYGTAPQYVLPAHVFEGRTPVSFASFSKAPIVGDGPYTFVSWKPGDRLVYRANPRYWRGRAEIDQLDIIVVPYPNSNLTLLRNGAIGFTLVAPVELSGLRNQRDLVFAHVPTITISGIALNLEHPPLDDLRIRRAIAMSIDRASISAKITDGIYPVVDSDRPRFSWAYDSSVKEPRYDPPSADRLLDAAGWRLSPDGRRRKDGKPLEFNYAQFTETKTGMLVATFVQRQLAQRGITVTVRQTSQAQLTLPKTGVLASGNFDLAYVPWLMGSDPDDHFMLGCGGAANYMHYCNRNVDRFERAAATESLQARRKRAYLKVDQLVARDVPIVYLFNAYYVYAHDKRLSGFAPNAFFPTWNAYEWSLK
jgi:ABC-type transport system substrate-binding protein